jgi:hypothetical protein
VCLEDYRLACHAGGGGATDDLFIIKNLPFYSETPRGHGSSTCPATRSKGGPTCAGSSSGTSKARTPAPARSGSCATATSSRGRAYVSTSVLLQALHRASPSTISPFQNGTTCTSLIHRLRRRTPKTTRELLDIASNHADGEEAIAATLNTPQGTGEAGRGPWRGHILALQEEEEERQAPS